jgi:hypothetical protein
MLRVLGVCIIGIAVLAVVHASAAHLPVNGGVLQVFAFSVDIDIPEAEPHEVPVDILPGSCPNPLNVKAGGILPVAILGTATFDVTAIDPSSVLLEGVAPVNWDLEDVATSFEPFIGKTRKHDCTIAGPDGYFDLALKFDLQSIVAAIGPAEDGDVRVLSLTAELADGTELFGEDVVVIVAPGPPMPLTAETGTQDEFVASSDPGPDSETADMTESTGRDSAGDDSDFEEGPVSEERPTGDPPTADNPPDPADYGYSSDGGSFTAYAEGPPSDDGQPKRDNEAGVGNEAGDDAENDSTGAGDEGVDESSEDADSPTDDELAGE